MGNIINVEVEGNPFPTKEITKPKKLNLGGAWGFVEIR